MGSRTLLLLLLVGALALSASLAMGARLTYGSKTSNKLLRQMLTKDKNMTPDQVRDLLVSVEDKQNTYVGLASVRFLLTYEDITLDRCLRLSQDKQERTRLGVCHPHHLEYVPAAYEYCRDRLGKQADLCGEHMDDLLDWQLKPLSQIETRAIEELTEAILTDPAHERYSFDSLEERTKLHFWRAPTLTGQQHPPLARGCKQLARTLGQIRLVPKYVRYFGAGGLQRQKLQQSARFNKWMTALQVCQTFNSLFEAFDDRDENKIHISENQFELYST